MKLRGTAKALLKNAHRPRTRQLGARNRVQKWPTPRPGFQIQRILAPVDFSEPCKKAVKLAVEMARESHAELILMHVVQPYPIIPELPAATPELNSLLQKNAVESLRRFAHTIKNFHVSHVVRVGNPAREVVAEAKARNADLIILSTHGRTGLAHLFLGSVAEEIVRLATCPVLTVRTQERDSLTNRVGRPRKVKIPALSPV